MKTLSKKTKRAKSETKYWLIVMTNLLVGLLSKNREDGYRGIMSVVMPSILHFVHMIMCTRFDFSKDRNFIYIKFVIIVIMNIYKTDLGVIKGISEAILIAIVSLITSFFINTGLRFFYAENDCLKRSNLQLFQNFIEIPDPIVFIDSTSY